MASPHSRAVRGECEPDRAAPTIAAAELVAAAIRTAGEEIAGAVAGLAMAVEALASALSQ